MEEEVLEEVVPAFYLEQCHLRQDEQFEQEMARIAEKILGSGVTKKVVFISYAWPYDHHEEPSVHDPNVKPLRETWTKSFVLNFRDDLVRLGFDVILDENNLGLGRHLTSAMDESVKKADHVFLMVSHTYLFKINYRPLSGVAVEFNATERQVERVHENIGALNRCLSRMTVREINQTRLVCPLVLVDKFEEYEYFPLVDGFGGYASRYLTKSSYVETLCDIVHKLYGLYERNDVDFDEQFKFFRRRATVPLLFERTFPVYSTESIETFDVWEKNSKFVGRNKELQDLRENLAKYSVSLIAPAITGARGVGKSQLANAFVHDAIERGAYPLIAWLNGSSRANTLNHNFRRFAQEKLGIKTGDLSDELIVKRVHAELRDYRKRNAKVLFILDDIPDEKTLRKYFPEHSRGYEHIHVLVTTPSQNWSHRFQKISLKAFSPEESVAFTCSMLPYATPEEARLLGDEVHHFPLALAQVVAFILAGNLKITTFIEEEYRPFQKKMLSYKISEVFPDANYERTVFTTWMLAVKELFNVNPVLAPYALAVMFVSAYCENEAIPRDLLIKLIPEEAKAHRTEVLMLLAKYSLLELGKPETYNTHQLLQEVIRLTAESSDVFDEEGVFEIQKIQAASGIPQVVQRELQNVEGKIFWVMVSLWYLYDYFDTERYVEAKVKDITEDQRRVLQHLYNALSCINPETLESQPLEFVAKLYFMISLSFVNTGNFSAAEECITKSISNYLLLRQKHEARFNASRDDFLFSLIIRGTIRAGLGNFEASLAELQVTLPMVEEAEFYGPDAENTKRLLLALCQMNLGIGYLATGDQFNGDFLFNKSVGVLEQAFDKVSYQIAVFYAQKASFLAVLGKAEESRKFLEESLELIVTSLGDKHPRVGMVYGQYASVLYGAGETKQAEEYIHKALPILETCYGKNHPHYLIVKGQQAAILCEQGEQESAKRILEEVIPLFESMVQADHPQVAISRGLLAKVYDAQGEFDKAVEFYKEALVSLTKHYGPAHSETNYVRRALGKVCIKAGEEKEGKQFLTEAELYSRVLMQSHSKKTTARYGIVDEFLEKEQQIKAFYNSVIPEGYVLGKALGKGDCFFDATASELNELVDEANCSVKSLRTLISAYAQGESEANAWLKNAFRKGSKEHNEYVKRIIYDAEETEFPIWGDPAIDGRIICETFDVRLHIIEYREIEGEPLLSHDVVDAHGLRTGEFPKEGWDDPRMIHLAVCNLHFVPVRRKVVKEKQKRAGLVMSGVTLQAFDAVPPPELLPDENELTAARRWIEISEKWLLSPYFERASHYFEKALAILTQHLGEEAQETQLCEAKLFCAKKVTDLSVFREERLIKVRQVIEASLTNNSDEPSVVFLALLELKFAQREQTFGDINCYEHSERVFEVLRKSLHPNDVRLAVCHMYYGTFLAIKRNNLRLARYHMIEIALPVLEDYFGKHSVKICSYLSQVASILSVDGDVSKAEKYLRRSLQIVESNPDEGWELLRAESQAQLAGIAMQKNQAAEALRLLDGAFPVLIEKLGEDNVQVGIVKGIQAMVLFLNGQLDEAEQKCKESLDILEAKYGVDNPQTCVVYGTKAALLNAKKETQEALVCIEKAVPVLHKHYGDGHMQTAIVYLNYANILLSGEDAFTQVRYVEDIVEKSRRVFERQGTLPADYYIVKSKAALFKHDLAEAKVYFEKSLEALAELPLEPEATAAGLYLDYAEACLRSKQLELAQEYFSAGLSYFAVTFKDVPLSMAGIYQKMGETCLRCVAFDLGEYYFEEALKIFRLHVGNYPAIIKNIYLDLGKSCLEAGHLKLGGKYIRAYREVIAIVEPESDELEKTDAFLARNELFEIEEPGHRPISPRQPQPHQDFFQAPVIDADALLRESIGHRRHGRYKEQCDCINRVLTIMPEYAVAHYQKARYLFEQGDGRGDLDIALDHLQRNLQFETDVNKNGRAYLLQARIYHKQTFLELALDSLLRAVETHPSGDFRVEVIDFAERVLQENPFMRFRFRTLDEVIQGMKNEAKRNNPK